MFFNALTKTCRINMFIGWHYDYPQYLNTERALIDGVGVVDSSHQVYQLFASDDVKNTTLVM